MTALILLRRRLSRSDSGLRRRAGSTRRGGGWKRNGGAPRKKCAVAAEVLPGKAWTSPAQITPRALRLKAPPACDTRNPAADGLWALLNNER